MKGLEQRVAGLMEELRERERESEELREREKEREAQGGEGGGERRERAESDVGGGELFMQRILLQCIVLRARSTNPGTDLAYAGTTYRAMCVLCDARYRDSVCDACAHATQCAVLRSRMVSQLRELAEAKIDLERR
eukprot:3206676-Rhodomonas_salina.8